MVDPKTRDLMLSAIPYKESRLTYAQRAMLRTVEANEAPNGFDPKSLDYRIAFRLFKRGLLNQVGTSSVFILTTKGTLVLGLDRLRRAK